jgi:hypothetical protein
MGEFNLYVCEYYHPQGKGALHEQTRRPYPKCQYAFSIKPFDYPAIHAIQVPSNRLPSDVNDQSLLLKNRAS